jgi:shikimate kinase/3-dehydroquinate synthase
VPFVRAPHPSTGPGPRLVLVGPPGAGKSTVASALGTRWGVAVRDTDSDVERRAGKPISAIFVDDGEPAFRALERAAVADALAEHDGVLALGGGAVLDAATQGLLGRYRETGGTVVFLDVSLAHAAPRVGFNQSRPLLLGNPRAQWQALMEARRPVYEAVASLRVSTDGLRPAAVAQLIEDQLTVAPEQRASSPTNRSPGQ